MSATCLNKTATQWGPDLLYNKAEAGLAVPGVLLYEPNLGARSVNEHWGHLLSTGTYTGMFLLSVKNPHVASYNFAEDNMREGSSKHELPQRRRQVVFKTNGQRASPGVKTPDSLRALKMERARAVRLGSLVEKK